jgi:hypothetical protein
MLCHLCGFGVVSVGLIFDLMKRLLDSFTPLDIELLLAILTRTLSLFSWHTPHTHSYE